MAELLNVQTEVRGYEVSVRVDMDNESVSVNLITGEEGWTADLLITTDR